MIVLYLKGVRYQGKSVESILKQVKGSKNDK